MSDLSALAQEAVDWMRRQEPHLESEVYLVRGQERSLEIREGKLESLQERQYFGAGVRVLHEGRMGFAYTADLNTGSIQQLFKTVVCQLPYLPQDSFRKLPSPMQEPGARSQEPGLRETFWDDTLFSAPLLQKMDILKEMEVAALGVSPHVKRVLRLGYSEVSGEVTVANTLGISASERGTHCEVGLSSLAQMGAEIQIGSCSDSKRFCQDLNFGNTARLASERAASLLNSRKLPTGRHAVLFDPWVAGEFLDLIAQALCADQIQKGKSLFRNKLGQEVASPLVKMVDDPLLVKGIASSLFDDEGVPTRTKVLVDGGRLQDYFYDTYTAARERKSSNGSASRASFKGVPNPGASNFYMVPGSMSRDKLIEDTQDGILVLEVMGMHTANPISGEFSVGVSGLAVEKGRITHGVKGAMISGTILELLGRVDAVADDLTFYGSMGSPTFRVADLTVA